MVKQNTERQGQKNHRKAGPEPSHTAPESFPSCLPESSTLSQKDPNGYNQCPEHGMHKCEHRYVHRHEQAHISVHLCLKAPCLILLKKNKGAGHSCVPTSKKEVTRTDGHLSPNCRGYHMGTDIQVTRREAPGRCAGEQGSLSSLRFQQNVC